MNYLIVGQDDYFVQKEVEQLINKLKVDPYNKTTYQCTQTPIEQMVEEALTIGLFAEEKLILIEQPFFLTTQSVKTPFDVHPDSLISLLERQDDQIHVVIVAKYEKLDERKKVVKTIKKLCQVIEAETLNEKNFESMLGQLIKSKKLELDDESYRYMVQYLEHDMMIMTSEVEKLSLYGQPITIDVIEKLMTKRLEDNVFLLVDAMVQHKTNEALRLLNDLMVQQVEPIKLVVLIAGQIRLLFQVKQLLSEGMTQQAIAQYLGVHPYRVKLAAGQTYRYSKDQLLQTLSQLASLDEGIKLGKVDKYKGLELFILRR